jgi:hypothetical protein
VRSRCGAARAVPDDAARSRPTAPPTRAGGPPRRRTRRQSPRCPVASQQDGYAAPHPDDGTRPAPCPSGVRRRIGLGGATAPPRWPRRPRWVRATAMPGRPPNTRSRATPVGPMPQHPLPQHPRPQHVVPPGAAARSPNSARPAQSPQRPAHGPQRSAEVPAPLPYHGATRPRRTAEPRGTPPAVYGMQHAAARRIPHAAAAACGSPAGPSPDRPVTRPGRLPASACRTANPGPGPRRRPTSDRRPRRRCPRSVAAWGGRRPW